MAFRSAFLASLLALLAAMNACAQPNGAEIQVQGPSGLLKGTLLAPQDPKGAPAAIIIPGSGPTDRNGDNPMGVLAAPYRLLAEALAADGVSTVRIDKRGMFGSAGAGDPNQVTLEDYAADVHAWAAEVRKETGAPCVWLIGHSEGGLVALTAAQQPKDLCGLVLVSAPGRPFDVILSEQLKANPANAPVLDEALAAIAKLKAGEPVDTAGMNPAIARLFAPQVQDFEINMMRHDPAKLLAAYPGPVLVLQGTTDLQVSMADAKLLAAARPGVKLVELDGVNHVLKAAPLDRTANMATYTDASLPLAPGIAKAIAAFIKSADGAK